MNRLSELFLLSSTPDDYVRLFCRRMAEVVMQLDPEATAALIDEVERASREDRTIFLAGNGGCAAVATHAVMDLSANSVVEGRQGIRVISLTDSAPAITAVANDLSFNDIFAVQLKAQMRPGDLVIVMSASGNSPNILRAVEYANTHGGRTFGCVGFDGGALKKLCHQCIHIEVTRDEYGPVEDMFGVIMHIVTGYLTMKRGRMLHRDGAAGGFVPREQDAAAGLVPWPES